MEAVSSGLSFASLFGNSQVCVYCGNEFSVSGSDSVGFCTNSRCQIPNPTGIIDPRRCPGCGSNEFKVVCGSYLGKVKLQCNRCSTISESPVLTANTMPLQDLLKL